MQFKGDKLFPGNLTVRYYHDSERYMKTRPPDRLFGMDTKIRQAKDDITFIQQ